MKRLKAWFRKRITKRDVLVFIFILIIAALTGWLIGGLLLNVIF